MQGEIERALTEICAAPIRITGAGRTDAGVHATGQVIDFRTASALDGEAIERGVNALLSKDIAISDVEAASEDFHSRFSATGRTYEYRIRRSRTRDPREWRKEHWLPGSLDVAAMKDASGSLIGRHDFAAFAAGVSGERTVRRAEWSEAGELLRFEIEADAFLRGMVRGIVGTLLWVGRGKIGVDRFAEVLRSRDRAQAGPSAPAQGLCLIRVEYGERRQRQSEEADE
ncbi:MAG: tRNA pseudouridine(38-40) synthase TruA [Chloroflexi bacterium]|nr:MAG: tRNA pseudouridine(38-40) synthase TruA [Chloroflexota bacterium]TMC58297.1 MAG: tRNA pseudouridine(38-40) synthase TruA [Chloroflexota bacterium]TME38257.1 MAG: tRNA pseudouridine(38-40) synthase TruA [Chloroflexota bacterium]